MNKNENFLFRNLSLLAFITVYIITAIVHIVADSFIFGDQLGLLIVFLPFLLLGLALDFILSRNQSIKRLPMIIAKLLPLGVIFLWLPNTILMNYGDSIVVQYYYYYIGYVVWFFIALPFFIASFAKEGFRQRTLHALTGTGAFSIAYIMLTSKSELLDKGFGFMIILVSYYFMLFTATGIKTLKYAAPVLGLLNTLALLLFCNYPFKDNGGSFGWDSNINLKIDIIILVTFALCIFIRIYGAFTANKKPIKK